MSSELNPKEIMAFLFDVTAKAGRAVLSYFEGDFRVDRKDTGKGGIDIVTDADRASEEIILQAITREFPDHDVLTEETETERSGSNWLWMVDPLDGTVNFAHGVPHFSVSIALQSKEILLAGIVHDPVRQENFSAVRGRGAILNGNAIRVTNTGCLTRSVLATGFPYDRARSPENNVAEFSKIVTRVQGLRRFGSAALDLAWVACGRFEGFWELKLKPWDQAAGMLIVEEAGGRVTDLTGRPTDPRTNAVVATNGVIHDELIALLTEASLEKARPGRI